MVVYKILQYINNKFIFDNELDKKKDRKKQKLPQKKKKKKKPSNLF